MRSGAFVQDGFVRPDERDAVVNWLAGLSPLWEQRYREPLPKGVAQRALLRPVVWLGSWQFACLDYYRPPRHALHRAVHAEPFPEPHRAWVSRIERLVADRFSGPDLPRGWALTTCLVNLYGDRVWPDGRREDRARVGQHRDFEPGPVASVSLGERALFQFVDRSARVVEQCWLGDGALQVFGGRRHKDQLFHRVQRVERRGGHRLPVGVSDFETRRVNFTFRFVPPEHVTHWFDLPRADREAVRGYVDALAERSAWWRAERDAVNG
jgi:hypothetical protein